MPFELEVWIAIIATFGIAIVIIFLLKSLSIDVQALVFGLRSKTPKTNLA